MNTFLYIQKYCSIHNDTMLFTLLSVHEMLLLLFHLWLTFSYKSVIEYCYYL